MQYEWHTSVAVRGNVTPMGAGAVTTLHCIASPPRSGIR
jgi:hypothetical protein